MSITLINACLSFSGHVTSGPDKSVQIVEMARGRHIEIHIRYVATTVIVRQVGQFLTFAIRMPEIIIEKRPPPRTNNGIDVGLMPMVRHVEIFCCLHLRLSLGPSISLKSFAYLRLDNHA